MRPGGWPNRKQNRKTPMKKTLHTDEIARALYSDEYGGWSRAGAYALAEYLEAMEEDTGEELEFCHVAIRCEFSEAESLEDWANGYFGLDDWRGEIGLDADADEDETAAAIRSYIEAHGQLVEFEGGVIVSSF